MKFGSDEPLSLIREGSGYWKYVPTADGIRFLMRYDYQTRFGTTGALFSGVMDEIWKGHFYGNRRRGIDDYLGSHEHLAVDIDMWVDDEGGLRLRSGAQRFYEGVLGFSFPMLFSGIADVREWYDDATRCFRIVVNIHNRVWGPLFGYRGRFSVDWRKVTAGALPNHILPRRQELRD